MGIKRGWGEVDKPRQDADSRFLTIEDGDTIVFRCLDEVPATVHVHYVSQEVNGENVFRSIPATDDPDDDYIDQMSNRYPAKPRHVMRVLVYDDEGEPDGVKALIGGVTIFRPMKKMAQQYGDIREFDIVLSRDGEGLDTEYTVTSAPKSHDIDVEEWIAEMEDDADWNLDSLFPSVTAEEQKRIIDEAGIDITYDPVQELVESMEPEEAANVRFGFGKYGPDHYPKGMKVGEVMEIDSGYVIWAADKVTSNDLVAAACRVVVDNFDALDTGPDPDQKKLKKGKKKKAKETSSKKKTKKKAKKAPEPEPEEETDDDAPTREDWTSKLSIEDYLARWYPKGNKVDLALAILEAEGNPYQPDDEEAEEEPEEDDEDVEEEHDEEEEHEDSDDLDDDDLLGAVVDIFTSDPRFENPTDIVKVVKKHGDGVSKIRDLDSDQLRSLYEDITS